MSYLMRIHSVDEGNSRVYYKTKNAKQEALLYCLMQDDNKGTIRCYRCSQDGEPSHALLPHELKNRTFHFPPWDREHGPSELVINVNKFIKSLEASQVGVRNETTD